MLYQSVHFPFEKWTRGIAYILVICISLEGKASHGKSLLPARGKFDNLCDFCDKSYEYISLSFSLPLSSSPGNRDLPNSLRRSPRFVAREIFHTKERQPFYWSIFAACTLLSFLITPVPKYSSHDVNVVSKCSFILRTDCKRTKSDWVHRCNAFQIGSAWWSMNV